MHCSIQRASDGYTTSPSGFFSPGRLQYGQLPSRTLPTKDITHSDFSNPYFYIHETFKKKFGIEMDRRQFGTNPLPKPTLTYCWLDGQQPISVKLYKQDVSNFIHKKPSIVYIMSAMLNINKYLCLGLNELTPWGWYELPDILQTILAYFSGRKCIGTHFILHFDTAYWYQFYFKVFLGFELTISHHRFRYQR